MHDPQNNTAPPAVIRAMCMGRLFLIFDFGFWILDLQFRIDGQTTACTAPVAHEFDFESGA
jgi:hypothetical protein